MCLLLLVAYWTVLVLGWSFCCGAFSMLGKSVIICAFQVEATSLSETCQW